MCIAVIVSAWPFMINDDDVGLTSNTCATNPVTYPRELQCYDVRHTVIMIRYRWIVIFCMSCHSSIHAWVMTQYVLTDTIQWNPKNAQTLPNNIIIDNMYFLNLTYLLLSNSFVPYLSIQICWPLLNYRWEICKLSLLRPHPFMDIPYYIYPTMHIYSWVRKVCNHMIY